jgi:hypothetical protein
LLHEVPKIFGLRYENPPSAPMRHGCFSDINSPVALGGQHETRDILDVVIGEGERGNWEHRGLHRFAKLSCHSGSVPGLGNRPRAKENSKTQFERLMS